MTNQKEQNQRKQQISLTLAILGLIACIFVIIWLILPRGNDGTPGPTPTPDPPQPDAVAREYWTAELEFYSYSVDLPLLKKVSVNGDGDVLKIESIRPKEANVREDFFYSNGKLDYSETYSVNPISYNGKEFSEEKLYETRYVYMGDIVTKAEVYVNGTPTRSYDKYVYKIGGELDYIEKYEKGKLEITYFYNGKDYPERVEHTNGRCYDLEYDENGNLTRVTGEDYLIEIDYENGNPTRYYKAIYDRKTTVDKSVMAYSEITAIKYERIKTFDYGEGGEIVKESLESLATTYSGEVRLNRMSYDILEKTYEYDADGRMTEEKYYFNNKFDCCRKYAYDSEGNLVSEVSCQENGDEYAGTEITRSTDQGLTVEKTYFFGDEIRATTSYKYDADGKLLTVSYVTSNEERNYKETYEYYPSGAKKKYTRVMEKYSETWTYAENGNLERYVWDYSDAEISEYITSDVYYGFMRREGSSDTFSLPLTIKKGDATTRYVYREDLTLENKTTYYSSGEYRVYEYDEKGILQTEVLYGADGNVIAQYYPEGK